LYLKPSSAVDHCKWMETIGGNLSHSNAVIVLMMMLTAEDKLYSSGAGSNQVHLD